MGNVQVDLPMPVANGPGAAVDVSLMGRDKTVVVRGQFPGATITIEISQDAGGAGVYAPIGSFQTGAGRKLFEVAARFMRVNVSGRKASVVFSANADVGANDMGAQFATLAMPALNGAGAATNVSALGTFCTFVCGGSFPGATITVEASEDGVDYGPVVTFSDQGGQQSQVVTAAFMRCVVAGRKASVPFSGSMAVGAINDPVNPSASVTNWYSFDYTADGTEGQTFTVPIPVARPNATYQVRHQLGAVFRQYEVNVLDATKLVGAFDIEVSTEPHDGDVIHFDVFNPPP